MMRNETKIKVLGERNSGTNYLEQLLRLNICGRILNGSVPRSWLRAFGGREAVRDSYFRFTCRWNAGWKHAMAPSVRDIERIGSAVAFVTISKNPYAWLVSMFRRPYHTRTRTKQTFEEFICAPWETVERERFEGVFKSPIDMWNQKNWSYVDLCRKARGVNVNYEDLLMDPETSIERLACELSLKKRTTEFRNVNEAVKEEDAEKGYEWYRRYYLEEVWRREYDAVTLDLVNKGLDFELLKLLGYKKIGKVDGARGVPTPGSAHSVEGSLESEKVRAK